MTDDRVIVYVPGVFDLLHYGHINVIKSAREYGKMVIIGLLTDEAAKEYKNLPVLTYVQREIVLREIKGVDIIIPQLHHSLNDNLIKLQPNIVIHGGLLQADVKPDTIRILKEWSGKLIELPYTEGISTTRLKQALGKEQLL